MEEVSCPFFVSRCPYKAWVKGSQEGKYPVGRKLLQRKTAFFLVLQWSSIVNAKEEVVDIRKGKI